MYAQLRDTFWDYKGGFGGAKKADIYDFNDNIQAPWQFIPADPQAVKSGQDGATFWLTNSGLESRYRRDFAYDKANPREQLPPSAVSLRQMNVIPNLAEVMPDFSRKEDYEAHNNVQLLQDSIKNYQSQRDFYSNPELFDEQKYNTEGPGINPPRGRSQQSLFSMDGNAAGKETNFLIDKSGTYRNSTEWIYAF